MSNGMDDRWGIRPAAGEIPDARPPSVRFQDAAILEYAVRNRLLRGAVPEWLRGNSDAPGTQSAGNRAKAPSGGVARTAARAAVIYRRIAPPDQEHPLRAVSLVRRLLAEGALDDFVLGKYRTHVEDCAEIGVAAMPLIPYLTELLEVHRVSRNAARRESYSA